MGIENFPGFVFALTLWLFGLFAYLLPWVIARERGHPQRRSILIVNLLLGWTFLGWVASLVWAVSAINPALKLESIPRAKNDFDPWEPPAPDPEDRVIVIPDTPSARARPKPPPVRERRDPNALPTWTAVAVGVLGGALLIWWLRG